MLPVLGPQSWPDERGPDGPVSSGRTRARSLCSHVKRRRAGACAPSAHPPAFGRCRNALAVLFAARASNPNACTHLCMGGCQALPAHCSRSATSDYTPLAAMGCRAARRKSVGSHRRKGPRPRQSRCVLPSAAAAPSLPRSLARTRARAFPPYSPAVPGFCGGPADRCSGERLASPRLTGVPRPHGRAARAAPARALIRRRSRLRCARQRHCAPAPARRPCGRERGRGAHSMEERAAARKFD